MIEFHELEELKRQIQNVNDIRWHSSGQPLAMPVEDHPLNATSVVASGLGVGTGIIGIPPQVESLSVTPPDPSLPPPSLPSRLKKGLSVKGAFSRYTLGIQIGQGGNARVFSAVTKDETPVAIKFLNKDIHQKRFENEILFCHHERHPNIVRVLDLGFEELEDGEHPFCVMPLYAKTLRKRLEEGLLHRRAIQIFVGLLSGVAEAHAKGIVHRDLKPENILFAEDSNEPIVADFGIAHFPPEVAATRVITLENDRMANRYYAAPEQSKLGATVGPPADTFALGLMLNELFTGSIPKALGFKRICDVDQEFGYLDALFEKLFQQDPEKRLPTAGAVLDELEQLALVAGDKETVCCVRNHRQAEELTSFPLDARDKETAISITAITKDYCSPGKMGAFTFDYSNHDGEYVIGEGDGTFSTRWSKASDTSIYALKDGKGIDAIALLKNVGNIESIRDIKGDFSSRYRTPRIGDAIVWKNDKGRYAITKIVSIKDDTRGSDHDELTCEYIILE